MDAQPAGIGDRVRSVRKRRGLSQAELARRSGLSLSLVKKLETGERTDVRLATARQLAVALQVPTTILMTEPDAPVPSPHSRRRWEPVKAALEGAAGPPSDAEPTLDAIRSAFGEILPLLLDGRFSEIGDVLPALLRDADALAGASADGAQVAARSLRAQIRQVAGALMLHTWQFDTADLAFAMALEDAPDLLTAMSVVEERCWGLIRQGKLAQTRELALRWAAENEPRVSTATRDELAAWGRLLIRASAAAIRDNRPGEAADALKLARMAAVGAGSDFLLPYSPWHVFGPVTVAVTAAEHAMIRDQPEKVLATAHRIAGTRATMPVPRYAPSHQLDVAEALAALRHDTEAVGVMLELRRARPQWFAQQRHAADILTKIIDKRRTLTQEMRELADAVRLPL